jgi:hypothetical protein
LKIGQEDCYHFAHCLAIHDKRIINISGAGKKKPCQANCWCRKCCVSEKIRNDSEHESCFSDGGI